MARYLLAIILFTFCSTNVIAKEKLNGNLTVVAVKNTESIKIDGVLDEDF